MVQQVRLMMFSLTPPSCLKLLGGGGGGVGLQHFSVIPSPLGFSWGFDPGWTGLGLGGFGTKGLGLGLDNLKIESFPMSMMQDARIVR